VLVDQAFLGVQELHGNTASQVLIQYFLQLHPLVVDTVVATQEALSNKVVLVVQVAVAFMPQVLAEHLFLDKATTVVEVLVLQMVMLVLVAVVLVLLAMLPMAVLTLRVEMV
jgi:undecaprenyl pyrophosphate phosphatase UppP